MSLIYGILLVLYLVGTIFADLPIYPSFTLTHSLMVFITPIMFLTILMFDGFRLKLTYSTKIFLLYCLVTFIFSGLLLLFTLYTIGEKVYNQSLAVKFLQAFISVSLLHFIVFYSLNRIISVVSLEIFKKMIFLTFLFLTFAGVIELVYPHTLDIFHASISDYSRLRLFYMEPSHAVLGYTTIALVTLALLESKLIKLLSIVMFLIIFFAIGSKGSAISILLSILFLSLKHRNLKVISFALPFLGVFAFYFFDRILPALLIDIERFTSFATRVSGIISTLYILLIYPAGLGYGSYLYFYPPILIKSSKFISEILSYWNINLNLDEIVHIVSYGENIGAKSGIAQAIMFNGWFAVIFFYLLFRRSFKLLNKISLTFYQKVVLELCVSFVLIQLLIGSEYTLIYSVWLPFVLIESLYYKSKKVQALKASDGGNINELQ